MSRLCIALLLDVSVHAWPIVLATVSTTITRTGYLNSVSEPLGPTPYPAIPAIGSVMTGTFSYNLAVIADNDPNPRASQILHSPAFVSLSAGPINTAFAAQYPLPANAMIELYDDFQPSSVAYDGFYGRASQNSGGQLVGDQSTIVLHWVTTGLSTLSTDAMQVLPSGVTFDLVRAVHYYEPTNDNNMLWISGELNSYTVSVSHTAEPAALLLIGMRFRARSRILDPNETVAP